MDDEIEIQFSYVAPRVWADGEHIILALGDLCAIKMTRDEADAFSRRLNDAERAASAAYYAQLRADAARRKQ